jgi:transposase
MSRTKKLNQAQIRELVAQHNNGGSPKEIAARLGISIATFWRYVADFRKEHGNGLPASDR